jgi:RNA polymerase primary sigma factor
MCFENENENMASYFSQIKEYPLLTKEEEEIIFNKTSLTEDDKEKLIVSNLKFVIQEAFKFKHSQIDIMDLIQAGNLGLIDAVKKYDPQKRISFIGFAKFDIRNRMIRALQGFSISKNIRIPDQTRLKISKIKKAKEEFLLSNKREATNAELSDELGFSESNIRKLSFYIDNHTTSIDALSEANYLEPSVSNKEIKETTSAIIRMEIEKFNLTDLEKDIIIKRFIEGVDFGDIVEIHNCSKEWIRKNQKSALRKLKESEALQDLFMEFVRIN